MCAFAPAGSKRWLQIAVNRRPELLLGALRRSGAIPLRAEVTWSCPSESDDFREYCDEIALEKAHINTARLARPLAAFWPARGPVWDAVGFSTAGTSVFLEAKAHIPEAASGGTKASDSSRELIKQSLEEARKFYAPRSTATWMDLFYQYGNRLAHHYFLTQINEILSVLVFLYFVNADDMLGPSSEEEWRGAIKLLHCALGLPPDLKAQGVFEAFLDVRFLCDAQGK